MFSDLHEESQKILKEKELLKKKIRHKKIQVLFFCLGVLWILLFPAVTVSTGELKCRGMFVDENALNPYHLETEISELEMSSTLAYMGFTGNNANRPPSTEELCEAFRSELKLSCYSHVYEQHLPGHQGVSVRQNLYTIMRPTPGADGKEAVVLAVTWPLSWQKNEVDGFRATLVLLKHFQQTAYMSKNIVFLVIGNPADRPTFDADQFHPGAQAWLNDYFSDFPTLLQTKRHLAEQHRYSLEAITVEHAGVIRAAACLELPASEKYWKGMQVLTAGINGQLPNMDIVAVSLQVFGAYSILLDRCMGKLEGGRCHDLVSRIAEVTAWIFDPLTLPYAAHQYLRRLFGMFSFMAALSQGPSHAHAHFLQHSVDAVTFRGIPVDEYFDPNFSKSQILTGFDVVRSLSQFVRSLNNLEEDLHHSFFYYLLPTPITFVEINEYFVALLFILMPLFLEAFSLVQNTKSLKISYTLAAVFTAELFGCLMYIILRILFYQQHALHSFFSQVFNGAIKRDWADSSRFAVMLWLSMITILYPLALTVLLQIKKSITGNEEDAQIIVNSWSTLKCFMAFSFVYCHVLLGIVNYSFAIMASLVAVPALLNLEPSRITRLKFWLHAAGLTILSPMIMFWGLGLLVPNISGMDMFLHLLSMHLNVGVFYIPYICIVYCPLHLLCCHILLV